MLAMQYNITLPNDYDMGIIRKRVENSGNKTDGFEDLKMKAYLVAEKGRYGNYVNQYAPFYLWENTEGMNSFLLGGPFGNIINSFGRPSVYHWIVLDEHVIKTEAPQYALIQTVPIHVTGNFPLLLEEEKAFFAKWAGIPSTTACIISYDPLTWEFCHYHMGTDLDALQKMAEGSLIYDVHHIS